MGLIDFMVDNTIRSDLDTTDVYTNTTITIDVIEGRSEVEEQDVKAFFLLATLKNLMKQFTLQEI